MGAARAHDDVAAGQVTGAHGVGGALVPQHGRGHGHDVDGLGQAAGAGVGAGEAAGRRLHDEDAPLAQCGHVRLGRRVQPHLGVHGRHHQDGARRGEQDVGEEVVGAAGRGTREQVGGGGRDDDEVGLLPDADVRDLGDVLEDRRGHGAPRQGGPRRRTHELERVRGGDHGDLVAGFAESPEDLARLVGGDPPGDTEDDATHVGHRDAGLRPGRRGRTGRGRSPGPPRPRRARRPRPRGRSR